MKLMFKIVVHLPTMKKAILITTIGLSSLLGLFTLTSGNSAESAEDGYCHNGRCSATNNAGNPCGNCSQSGSYYCWSHNR